MGRNRFNHAQRDSPRAHSLGGSLVPVRFLGSALVAGLSVVAVTAFLSACNGTTDTGHLPVPVTPTPTTTPVSHGTPTPVPTPSPTPTQSPVPTPTPKPTKTPKPTPTPTPTPVGTPTPTPSPTPIGTPTPSPTPTATCGGALTITPCPVVFTPSQKADVYLKFDNGNIGAAQVQLISENCSAQHIATINPLFSYAWFVSVGTVNGSCSGTFQVLSTGAQGTVVVNNSANALRPRK